MSVAAEFLACLVLRLLHYAVVVAAVIWIILGGVDEFVASYETLTGWIPFAPQGQAAALALIALGHLVWALIFSSIQVAAYRRALRDWPEPGAFAPPVPPIRAETERGSHVFDPRAIVLAAFLATVLLLTTTAWPLLLAVTAWLVPAWFLSRPDRDAIPLGLALAGLIAFASLTGGLLSDAGLEVTLQRALRAVLLVAVATWMRAAAGPGGLREVFRRMLTKLRWIPAMPEAAGALEGLDPGPRLIAAGRAAASRFSDVDLRPLPLADAVTGWVRDEAEKYVPAPARPAHALRLRAADGLLVALTLAPAFALVGVH